MFVLTKAVFAASSHAFNTGGSLSSDVIKLE